MTVRDIAQETGLAKSTVHRLKQRIEHEAAAMRMRPKPLHRPKPQPSRHELPRTCRLLHLAPLAGRAQGAGG